MTCQIFPSVSTATGKIPKNVYFAVSISLRHCLLGNVILVFVDLRLAEIIQGRLKLKFVDTSRSVHPKYPEIFNKAMTFQTRQTIQVSHPPPMRTRKLTILHSSK
jgi:hypothetical protein